MRIDVTHMEETKTFLVFYLNCENLPIIITQQIEQFSIHHPS